MAHAVAINMMIILISLCNINDSHGNDMMISIIEQQIILVFFAKELFHSNFF